MNHTTEGAWGYAGQLFEYSREVTLIGESSSQGDVGKSSIRSVEFLARELHAQAIKAKVGQLMGVLRQSTLCLMRQLREQQAGAEALLYNLSIELSGLQLA